MQLVIEYQQKLILFIFVIQLFMVIGLGVLTFLLFQNQELLNKSRDVEFQSYLLADQLRQSSDDLTRLVRSYAASGNAEFERQYWAVLAIRDGKMPRPEQYNRIYWDLILGPKQKPRSDGEQISLRELMIKEGFSEMELKKLASAQKHSDGLVRLETIAMNAVKGLFEDENGSFTIKKAADRKMAVRLLNDKTYHEKKFKIMKPIDEFFELFGKRTSEEAAIRRNKSKKLLIYLMILIASIMGMFIFSFLAIRQHLNKRKHVEHKLYDAVSGSIKHLGGIPHEKIRKVAI
jgi:methyl-accepting chemotaxis protein